MPNIISAVPRETAGSTHGAEPIPDGTPVKSVEDLNGQFSPHTGNIQPTVVDVQHPVQVEVIYSADDVPGGIVVAYIDDWARSSASRIARCLTRDAPPFEITTPTAEPVTPIANVKPQPQPPPEIEPQPVNSTVTNVVTSQPTKVEQVPNAAIEVPPVVVDGSPEATKVPSSAVVTADAILSKAGITENLNDADNALALENIAVDPFLE